jgi:hypothetical protein
LGEIFPQLKSLLLRLEPGQVVVKYFPQNNGHNQNHDHSHIHGHSTHNATHTATHSAGAHHSLSLSQSQSHSPASEASFGRPPPLAAGSYQTVGLLDEGASTLIGRLDSTRPLHDFVLHVL